MKNLFALVLILLLVIGGGANAQFGSTSSLKDLLNIVSDSTDWIPVVGLPRITTKDNKAVQLDSLITVHTVSTYDSVKATVVIDGPGGSSVPLTVLGDKTSGNLLNLTNDQNRTAGGDSSLSVNAKGQLGVHNSTPDADVDVNGTGGSTVVMNLDGNKTSGNLAVFTNEDAGTVGDSTIIITPAGRLGIRNSGSATRDITTGGVGASYSIIQLLTSTSGYSEIDFTDGLDGYAGFIKYDHSTDKLSIATAATEKIGISSTGAITTNTSGSSIGLSIDGNKTSGNLFQAINDNNGAVGDSSVVITSKGAMGLGISPAAGVRLHIYEVPTGGYTGIRITNGATAGGSFGFFVGDKSNGLIANKSIGLYDLNASAYRVVVDSVGHTGLFGVTSPKNALDVEGAAVIGATYSGTNTAPANGLLVEGHTTIGGTSNVGVLDVIGGDRDTGIRHLTPLNAGIVLQSTSSGGHSWNIFSSIKTGGTKQASLAFYDVTRDVYRAYFDTTGVFYATKIGIGPLVTTVSGATLDVNGNKSSDSLLIVRNDRVGAPYDSVFSITQTGSFTSTGKGQVDDSLRIGPNTTIDQQVPVFTLKGDADSDVGAVTTEQLGLTLIQNATPGSAYWKFTSSQAYGYAFDKPIYFLGGLWLDGASGGIISKSVNNSVVCLIGGNSGSGSPSVYLYGSDYSSSSYKGTSIITIGGDPTGTPGDLNSYLGFNYIRDGGAAIELARLTKNGYYGVGTGANAAAMLHANNANVISNPLFRLGRDKNTTPDSLAGGVTGSGKWFISTNPADTTNFFTVMGKKNADTLMIVANDIIHTANYDSAFVVLPTGGIRSTGTYGGSAIEPVTVAGSATSFAVTKNNIAVTGDAGGNTIATITGGGAIGLYVFKFIDDKITITDTDAATANTINLSGAFTSTANDIMVLFWDGSKWFESSRSVN